jgi:hypothetical protein
MKKFILAALVALPLTALSQQRAAAGSGGCGDCCTPLYRVGMSIGIVWRGWCGCDYSCCKQKCNHCGSAYGGGGGGGGGASFPGGGPWYGYWPHPAHFQTPAPTGYPYWPAPMTYSGYGAAPMQMPMDGGYAAMNMQGMQQYGNPMANMPVNGNFGGMAMNPAAVQPTAYYPQAPAYWYGQ